MDKWLANYQPKDKNDMVQSVISEELTKTIENQVLIPKKSKVIRRYNEEYIKYGFTILETEYEPLPQCVVCHDILSNQCMKPAFMKRHLNTRHQNLKNKPKEFFIMKKEEMKTSKNIMTSFYGSTKKVVEASYLVSLKIAKCGKPHNIGEELILPATKDIVKCMLGEELAQKLGKLSLSNDTVRNRINAMASNVKSILLSQIRQSKFYAIQVDESTDIANLSQLLVYVRYIYQNQIKEDILFCESLPSRITADEIYNKINDFFTENRLEWSQCIGFCSDGARAMTGKYGGVATKIKAVAPDCTFTHCVIHREALCIKRMPKNFEKVLREAIKVVNFIKSRALNSRLFSLLCSDMGSDHIQLLLHTEIRWLSRGKMLGRLIELRLEVQTFIMEKEFDIGIQFDEMWWVKLSYLSDIFNRLNDLNLSLQGPTKTAFVVNDKIKAMIKKLHMIKDAVSKSDFQSLPNLERFLTENEIEIDPEITNDIKSHCEVLVKSFGEYFNEDYTKHLWIQNPFVESPNEYFSFEEQEAIIDLSCDSSLQIEFRNTDLCQFWLNRESEYNSLFIRAIKFLLPFTTTYLCEIGFSSMVAIKNKYRTRLNLEPDLRLKLTKIEPDIDMLISKMQIQPSH